LTILSQPYIKSGYFKPALRAYLLASFSGRRITTTRKIANMEVISLSPKDPPGLPSNDLEDAPYGASKQSEDVSTLYNSLQLPPRSKSIRVLDVLPACTSSSCNTDIIEANLRIINLEDSPKFTALSYA
jgi:hypothetical protein